MDNQFMVSTARVETLVDGIFAIAMTILVFNIKLPEGIHSIDTRSALAVLWPTFWTFGQSFLLLGAVWSAHHRQGHFIKEARPGFVWMNIIWLMFVVLVPFSTSLLTVSGSLLGTVVFDLNLFIVGLLAFLTWHYAVSHGLIHAGQEGRVTATTRRGLILPGVALLALGFAFVSPTWSNLCYLLIPIGVRAIRPKISGVRGRGRS